jgi:hypothetical protein
MEGESKTLTAKSRIFVYLFNGIFMFLVALAAIDAAWAWWMEYPINISHLILVAFAVWLILLVLGKEVVAAWRTR